MSKKNKNNTPKLTPADQSVKGDSTLAEVMKDFNKARNYISGHYEKIWSECFKAYNSIRTRQGYVGVANEFVPETFAIVESLKAAIAGTKPKFKYLPLTEEQEQDTTTLNALVDFYWSCNNMTEKMLNWVGDMIIYGNGIFMVSWENGRPLIQHIPLSDFFVDPAATHMNRPEEPGYPRYAGYRFLTSLKQLKEEKEVDPETGEVRGKYKNLDVISLGTQDDNMDKDRKEMYIGSTFGRNAISEQVEVITYYTQYRKVMIANRGTVIYDGENPYHKAEDSIDTAVEIDGEVVKGKHKIPEIKGFLPFAILRNYVDSSLFFARGDVEVILPAQEALNDTASQKRDNVAYVLNNMWQIDPRFKHMAEQIESSPGAVFPIPKGALSPIEKNDISPSADSEIERQRQQMRNATGADAAVQGVAQKFSRTTATEVQAQLQQASMRFTTKVQNLEDEGFAQLARIIYKMIQIFVDTETAVRIVGKKGVEWQTYKPGTYQGEYEPRVVLEATMDAETAALSQAMQVAAQFSLGNPLVNQEAFLRQQYKVLFGKFLSDDDIEEMLTAPQPVMGPDGQAIDPSLTQADTVMTPGAQALMSGGSDEVPTSQPSSRSARLRQQSGTQGGGGADTSQNNIRRIRADQPSTTLHASSRPR